MQYQTETQLRKFRPGIDMCDGVDFALEALFADDEHTVDDVVCKGLTFEELIGVLLLCEDYIIKKGGYRP